MNLEPCPVCGGTADDPNWHGVIELFGRGWQTCSVTCKEDGRFKTCDFGISITVDDNAPNPPAVESILIESWNQLALRYNLRME